MNETQSGDFGLHTNYVQVVGDTHPYPYVYPYPTYPTVTWTYSTAQLTEDDVRRIIKEELKKLVCGDGE